MKKILIPPSKNLTDILRKMKGARLGLLPKLVKPQFAYLSEAVPETDDWIHEIKYDGYRIIVKKNGNQVNLLTRNHLDWTDKILDVRDQFDSFPAINAVLDGEILVQDRKGISRFQLLQNSLKLKNSDIIYYVFDILYCAGFNLRNCSLIERRKLLTYLFQQWPIKKHNSVFLSSYIQGQGADIYKEACKQGLEGIISKRIDSAYVNKRSRSWLKLKCLHQEEFVIGGFTAPQNSRRFFGALLLGYYKKNQFIYCGRVGTGFSQAVLQDLYQNFQKIIIDQPPFYNKQVIPNIKSTTWLKPKYVCQIKFTEWTQDNRLRHPSYLGLRLDKNTREVMTRR